MKYGGIYIHIPFCTEKCIYCDFYSLTKHENQIDAFVERLCKEIRIKSSIIDLKWKIDTIFIGGGTPSLLEPFHIEKIIKNLDNTFNLNYLNEFTIEANPSEFNIKKMKAFKELGINRVSFGFQSLNNEILKFLTRWHTSEDCIRAYNNARIAGFENINVDMIYGIPNQSIFQWKKDLNHIIDLNPEHISAYSLTVEKNTPLHTYVSSNKIIMPQEKIDIDMYAYTMETLNNGHYKQYEISNYSQKGKRCKHNLHYWKREPYLAFGPSAHGYYDNKRYWNIRNLNQYIKKIDSNQLPIDDLEILNEENIFNEMIINGLRISDGINISKIKSKFSKQTYKCLTSKVNDWSSHIEKSNEKIKLTKKGYFIADEITLDLMNSYVKSY